jgi:hypothetical protein
MEAAPGQSSDCQDVGKIKKLRRKQILRRQMKEKIRRHCDYATSVTLAEVK